MAQFPSQHRMHIQFWIGILLAFTIQARAEDAWKASGAASEPKSETKSESKSEKKEDKKDGDQEKRSEHKRSKKSDQHHLPTEEEGTSAANAGGHENTETLILKVSSGCYVVEFESIPGELISCKKALPIKYSKRECGTRKIKERARGEALVSCESKDSFDIRFRTTTGMVAFQARVSHEQSGRPGVKTQYMVRNPRDEVSSLMQHIAEPQVIEDEKLPDETPLKFKFSGFIATEVEHTARIGTSSSIANFDRTLSPKVTDLNIFSNVFFEVEKNNTSGVAGIEFGEVYFGDSSSGGSVGTRSNSPIQLRNLYVKHSFFESLSMSGGLITTNGDPRAFVFSDHIRF